VRFQWGRDLEFQAPNGIGPSVLVTNGINFGMPDFLPRPAYPDERRWQVAQNLSWLRGRHSVKFGYDVNWIHDKIINLFQGGGVYSYSNLNNLTLDCPKLSLPLGTCNASPTTGAQGITAKHYTSFTQAFDTLGQAGTGEFSNRDYGFYVEDSFKPMTNLTLNLGLRYELETMPTPNSPAPGLPGTEKIHTDRNNFGPRFGFSWDPFKKQKTVVRGGVGMFYGRTQNGTISSFLRENGSRLKTFQFLPNTAGSPDFPRTFSSIPSGVAGRPDSLFASSDFANPLTYQAELAIEQEITRNLSLTITGLSTRAQRLPLFRDINLLPPTDVATYTLCAVPQAGSAPCSQVARTLTVPFFPAVARPNPSYGRITIADSVVNAWYNALVVQARHRFSHGFQMQAAFTYSKAQDDGQSLITFFNANQPLNPLNVRDDYSVSSLDQRKRFTLSGYWMLPFGGISSRPLRAALNGLQLSSILTLADGRPYSPAIAGNPTPAGASTGILGAGGAGRVPFVGRNIYINPGLATVDLRIAREIKFTERLRWQLIAEAFNLANRVNISGINATQYNLSGSTLFPRTDFQSIQSTGTNLTRERQFQLGTRFTF